MSIMMCYEGKTLQKLSHEETQENTRILEAFFRTNIPRKSYISLCMTHNVHVPALISSMKNCGHIFVPTNKNDTNEEIQELVEEASVQYLVSLNDTNKSFENFDLLNNLVVGDDEISLWKNKIEREPSSIDESILCIIPTSGTTGKRKLIKIESYCIEKNVESLGEIFDLNENDVIFYGTPLTFDPSLVELFLAIKSKATLLIVPELVKLNPESLFQTLFPKTGEYSSVTFLQTVPSLFLRWSDNRIRHIIEKSGLKILVLGGEPFPTKISKFEGSTRIFNVYGITEISCWATIFEVKRNEEVFIGNPLSETDLKICRDGEELDEGIGEIFIGSETRNCYVNEETEKVKWRSTGDIVEKTSRGIKYLGRKDSRIKRLGLRVFLDKIEEKIHNQTELISKLVWLEEDSKLLLFVLISSFIPENKSKILDKLRVKLLRTLSKEEFPDFLDVISKFPVTRNGKLDKETLKEIYKQHNENQRKKQPSKVFLTIISKYLGHSLKTIFKLTNFTFENLGGDSISFTLITNELSYVLNRNLPSDFLSLMFNGSIQSCLNFLDDFEGWETLKNPQSDSETFEPKKKIPKYSMNVKVLWKFDLLGCVDSTPLIFEKNGRVFVAVGSFSNFFAILDCLTGKKKYLHQFPDSVGSEASVSPCSSFLYFGCFDGKLYCVDLEDFVIAWSYQTGSSIKCKPGFCLEGKAVVFGSYDKNIHCIDFENGKIIWKTFIGESTITTPIHHSKPEQILVTTLSGSCISLSEKTGSILWRIKLENPIFSTPVLIENTLIICDVLGTINLIHIDSGRNLAKTKLEGEIYSSIKRWKDHFVVTSTKGILYKCKLTDEGSDCQVVDMLKLGNSISSSPVVIETGDRVLVAAFTTKGEFYLANLRNMEILTCWKGPGDVYSSCVHRDSKLYVGCRDDNLYCLELIY